MSFSAGVKDGVSLRWDMGLNKKRIAVFRFGRDEYEARLVRTSPLSVLPLWTRAFR